MDITQVQIAKLVLGYLKLEKCQSAYNEFLKTSDDLKEYKSKEKRKHIATRFLGKTLKDILLDYVNVSVIVQEHLDDTDYYNQEIYSTKLVSQLLYLLKQKYQLPSPSLSSSRSSTPFDTDLTANKAFTEDLSVIYEEGSPDINATSLNSLPGNNLNSATPKCKVLLPVTKSHRSAVKASLRKDVTAAKGVAEEAEEDKKTCVDNVIQKFTQTILQHEDLQEKIAQNINNLRHNESDKLEELGMDDIDSAIQAVLDKTDSDPAFEKLMGEIIVSVQNSEGANVLPNKSINLEIPPVQSIEDQNKGAIDSIISASTSQVKTYPHLQPIFPKPGPSDKLTIHTAPDNILYNGPFDTNVNRPTTVLQPPYVVSTSGLLMMKPVNQPNKIVEGSINSKTPQLDLRMAQLVNTNQQQPLILSYYPTMPISCDNNTNKIDTLPPNNANSNVPKNCANNIANYYNMCGSNSDSMQDIVVNKPAPKPQTNRRPRRPVITVRVLEEESKPETKPTEAIEETKLATPDVKPQTHTTTPRSENNHVRLLDFNFHTPGKEVIPVQKVDSVPKATKVPKSPPKGASKTVKTLFPSPSKPLQLSSNSKPKMTTSWDEDLRMLAGQEAVVPPKKKRVARKPAAKGKNKPDLNKTEEDAKMIETQLAELNSPNETKEPENPKPTKKSPRKVTKMEILPNTDLKQLETPQDVIDMGLTLTNINAKPKYQKKCNIDNNRVTATRVKEIKNIAPTSDKLVLSPSKLNTNKGAEPEKTFLTPEVGMLAPQIPPSTAKRNVIPTLETPIKEYPNTPGCPSHDDTEDTPLTKVFKEHFRGIDLASIETPKFPITPNFPFTPLLGQSPYSHRGTDYSTSSSYYQPSDTEQNKSLETMIIAECNRPDIKKSSPLKPQRAVETNINSVVDSKQSTAITQKLNMLSSNVIARKNLNLVKNQPSDTSSDESSSEDSESSDNSDSGSSDTEPNETVIKKEISPAYSLRSKQSVSPIVEEDKNIQATKNIISDVEYKPHIVTVPPIEDYQSQVLKEMEEKRKRTIEMFKTGAVSKPKTQKTPVKKTATKTVKKAPLKTGQPVKRTLRSNSVKTLAVKDPPKRSNVIHSDDERLRPFETVEPIKSTTPVPVVTITEPKIPALKKSYTIPKKKRVKKSPVAKKPKQTEKKSNEKIENEMELIHSDKTTENPNGEALINFMEMGGFPLMPNDKSARRPDVEDGEVLSDNEKTTVKSKSPKLRTAKPSNFTRTHFRSSPNSPNFSKYRRSPNKNNQQRWFPNSRRARGQIGRFAQRSKRFSLDEISPKTFRNDHEVNRKPINRRKSIASNESIDKQVGEDSTNEQLANEENRFGSNEQKSKECETSEPNRFERNANEENSYKRKIIASKDEHGQSSKRRKSVTFNEKRSANENSYEQDLKKYEHDRLVSLERVANEASYEQKHVEAASSSYEQNRFASKNNECVERNRQLVSNERLMNEENERKHEDLKKAGDKSTGSAPNRRVVNSDENEETNKRAAPKKGKQKIVPNEMLTKKALVSKDSNEQERKDPLYGHNEIRSQSHENEQKRIEYKVASKARDPRTAAKEGELKISGQIGEQKRSTSKEGKRKKADKPIEDTSKEHNVQQQKAETVMSNSNERKRATSKKSDKTRKESEISNENSNEPLNLSSNERELKPPTNVSGMPPINANVSEMSSIKAEKPITLQNKTTKGNNVKTAEMNERPATKTIQPEISTSNQNQQVHELKQQPISSFPKQQPQHEPPKNIQQESSRTQPTTAQSDNSEPENIEFDIARYDQEDVIAYHDPNHITAITTPIKNLSQKKLTVVVFVEEAQIEVEKTLCVTPFMELLHIPDKTPPALLRKRRNSVKILNCVTIPASKKPDKEEIVRNVVNEATTRDNKGDGGGSSSAIPKKDDGAEKCMGKRLAEDESEASDVKKVKAQDCTALLKAMDLDKFLMKLHGDV